MSKQLKKRGFKFVGPVIVYAFMQAAGMVNDHSPLASAATPPAASKFVRYFALYPLHTHSSASGSVCCRTPRSTCPAFRANTNWYG